MIYDANRSRGVSPTVSVILVVAITVILAVGIFAALGGFASNSSEPATGYTQIATSTDSVGVTVQDAGNADEFIYLVNGDPIYTISNAGDAVGESILLSDYASFCAGDELTVVGTTGDSQTVLQTESVKTDINCDLSGTNVDATAEHDGTSWIIETSLTNTGDTARDYTILLTDGDTYETEETITLEPGESTTIASTTDSFSSDSPPRVGVISPSSDSGTTSDSSYTLTSSGGSGTATWVGGPSSGSTFVSPSSDDGEPAPTSDHPSSIETASTDDEGETGSGISLSTTRTGTGQPITLYATLATSKSPSAEETLVVQATRTEASETTEVIRSTHTLEDGEPKAVEETFSLPHPGEYLITASLADSGDVHTVGTLTIVDTSESIIQSASISNDATSVGGTVPVSATIENTGASSETVTLQFFESGEVFSESELSLSAGDTQTVTREFPPTTARTHQFHVGLVEPALIESAGEITVTEGASVAVTTSPSDSTVDSGTEVTLAADASHSEGTPIETYEWSLDDGTTETTTVGELSHTFETAGTYEYTVTAIAEDGVQATASGTVAVDEVPPTDGLVSHLEFESGSGTTAVDSARSASCTINGASWTEGYVGTNALAFDGTDDWVNCGNDAAITTDLENGHTFSAWVKTTATSQQRIIDNDYSEDNSFMLLMLDNGSIRYSLNASDNSWVKHDSTQTINDGEWHFVAGRFDGDTMHVTVDEGTINRPAPSLQFFQEDVSIGRKGQEDGSEYWNGSIDDIRMYDHSLSDANLARLYETTNADGE